MTDNGPYGDYDERARSQRLGAETAARVASLLHTPDCFWNRAEPSIDGDEGACCTCGAYEEKQVEWLRRNRPEAIHDRP